MIQRCNWPPKLGETYLCDFAIVAAQERELASLLRLADDPVRESLDDDFVYRVSLGGIQGVIAPLKGIGRVDAALATIRLFNSVAPDCLYLVGVAGGFPKSGTQLGDILVSEKIVDYAIRRISDDGEEFRLRTFNGDSALVAAARDAAIRMEGRYRDEARELPPKVLFGPVLSGDKVIASALMASRLMRIYDGLLGVEMEGAGVAAAVAHLAKPVRFLMIRGVVDLADDNKRRDSEMWSARVCDALAEFTIATVKTACEGGKSTYTVSK